MKSFARPPRQVSTVLRRKLLCQGSGTEYDIHVTGFYTDDGVLNVEFFYNNGNVDARDNRELEAWQTVYVASLGRRVR